MSISTFSVVFSWSRDVQVVSQGCGDEDSSKNPSLCVHVVEHCRQAGHSFIHYLLVVSKAKSFTTTSSNGGFFCVLFSQSVRGRVPRRHSIRRAIQHAQLRRSSTTPFPAALLELPRSAPHFVLDKRRRKMMGKFGENPSFPLSLRRLFPGCLLLLLIIAAGVAAAAADDGDPEVTTANGGSPDEAVDHSCCSEPRDKGTACPHDGTAPSKQFYYNTQMGVCQPFLFKGCEGNSNRFESADECKKACASSGKQDSWVLADRCNATHLIPDGHYIECAKQGGGQTCPQGHECRGDVCCPSREFVCSLRDDTGTFAEGLPDKPRFAWSDDVHSCWRFSYYGAKGNYNNFPSFQDCLSFCGPAAASRSDKNNDGQQ